MIELRNVKFGFSKKKRLFDNFNLKIDEASIVSILGESGVGKTTLAKILAGLYLPLEGGSYLDNKLITSPTRDVVFIHQENDLFEWLTVFENIDVVLKDKKKSEKILKKFNMIGYTNSAVSELSGGMRKKVMLARALAAGSRVIVMDEPFNFLDLKQKEIVYKEIKNITEFSGVTIVLITHDVEEAFLLSDRIIFLGGNESIKIVKDIEGTEKLNYKDQKKLLLSVLN